MQHLLANVYKFFWHQRRIFGVTFITGQPYARNYKIQVGLMREIKSLDLHN